jgi:hypothetical protein
MKIILTQHAKTRMKERKITRTEVFDAISNPDALTRKAGQTVFKKIRKNGQLLIIYIAEEYAAAHIVTVITTSKLSKYLK